MKIITCLIFLSLFSFCVQAESGVSLNEAVNQVQSEGRVLSAKTINGRHEIKVLTPNGTVKIINKKATTPTRKNKPPRPEFKTNNGQPRRDTQPTLATPNRFNSQQKFQTQRQANNPTLDFQRKSKNSRNNRKSSNKKEKDK